MRTVVYSRVSTDAQERDGTSLDTQESACHGYANAQGWTVIESIRDAASGASLDRPGLSRLRQLLRQGEVDLVLAYAVDRLSRNQNQIGVLFEDIKHAGARLEFVTEKFENNAIGRFILSASTFMAEVEREKILERTTRGKLERARGGKIPQAMGRGTYGYEYNRATGKRVIETFQAEVVRRIFQRYLETRSFSAVAGELNEEGIPALGGGLWYPLTIRRMLLNESYTGRLYFQKTQSVKVPTKNGKTRRQPKDRPQEDWIEIPGASPRIIDDSIWNRVQSILNDPDRVASHPQKNFYPFVGRIKCGVCGSAMVGHTMKSSNRDLSYYVCGHTSKRHIGRTCKSKHVRTDRLEAVLWTEVRRILTDPTIVLAECNRLETDPGDPEEQSRIEHKLDSLREQEQRLVKLFTLGEIDEEFIHEEKAALRKQRTVLEERLAAITPVELDMDSTVDMMSLSGTCEAVGAWMDGSSVEDRQLILEALQISIIATHETGSMSGVLPVQVPEISTWKRASA